MVLHQLKTHTSDLHQHMENRLEKVLFRPDLSTANYSLLLQSFYTLYQNLEGTIMGYTASSKLMENRSKLRLLEKDITYLEKFRGQSWEPTTETTTVCYIYSEPSALGAMYVLEGATLGGRMISKYLMRHPWIDLKGCLNFFNSYGEKRGDMWKLFITSIEEYAQLNTDKIPSILDGALNTFKYLDGGLYIDPE